MVWEARRKAEEKIYKTLNSNITVKQRQKLDMLLETVEEESRTRLAWIKEVPSIHSPESFLKVIKRLQYIQKLILNINMSGIHHNRLIQLSRLGKKYEPHSLRRFDDMEKFL